MFIECKTLHYKVLTRIHAADEPADYEVIRIPAKLAAVLGFSDNQQGQQSFISLNYFVCTCLTWKVEAIIQEQMHKIKYVMKDQSTFNNLAQSFIRQYILSYWK